MLLGRITGPGRGVRTARWPRAECFSESEAHRWRSRCRGEALKESKEKEKEKAKKRSGPFPLGAFSSAPWKREARAESETYRRIIDRPQCAGGVRLPGSGGERPNDSACNLADRSADADPDSPAGGDEAGGVRWLPSLPVDDGSSSSETSVRCT